MQISDLNNEYPKDILIHKLFTHALLTILYHLFFIDIIVIFPTQVRKCSALKTDLNMFFLENRLKKR